jgi:hypothetical protein
MLADFVILLMLNPWRLSMSTNGLDLGRFGGPTEPCLLLVVLVAVVLLSPSYFLIDFERGERAVRYF